MCVCLYFKCLSLFSENWTLFNHLKRPMSDRKRVPCIQRVGGRGGQSSKTRCLWLWHKMSRGKKEYWMCWKGGFFFVFAFLFLLRFLRTNLMKVHKVHVTMPWVVWFFFFTVMLSIGWTAVIVVIMQANLLGCQWEETRLQERDWDNWIYLLAKEAAQLLCWRWILSTCAEESVSARDVLFSSTLWKLKNSIIKKNSI